MSAETELSALLDAKSYIVAYSPLRTEVDCTQFARIPQGIPTHTIPPRASLDPVSEAKVICDEASGGEVAMFIPGRRFDASGTRHGQGGGWYDRFLAEVPKEWLRIGFCFSEQFSTDPLPRESWDQAVDYVVVVNRKTGAASLYSAEGHHD